MKKRNILFVVDEKQMGGVSVLLSDILKKINLKKYAVDIMVLHNNGEYLDDLPKEVNIIYGTKFFNTVDYSLKEVLKSRNIRNIFNKLYTIFLMKTMLIGNKIKKERRKCINKIYDVEIAFKDGFCALFTAYGDSRKKYHWLHTDYSMPVAETASIFNENIIYNAAIEEADKKTKFFIIENQLQDLAQIMCDIYSRYLFESEVFEKRKNAFLFANDLENIRNGNHTIFRNKQKNPI